MESNGFLLLQTYLRNHFITEQKTCPTSFGVGSIFYTLEWCNYRYYDKPTETLRGSAGFELTPRKEIPIQFAELEDVFKYLIETWERLCDLEASYCLEE